MASLGHLAVGMLAGRLYTNSPAATVSTTRAMVAFSALSFLPDLDVLGFRLGIAYAEPLGHRGASHALFTALVFGLASAALAMRFGLPFRRTAVFAVGVAASHGVLDCATDGGLGCALLWPFSDTRYFWPWTPLPVAPIGRRMLSERGLIVVLTELLWFLPLFVAALWPRGKSVRARSP